MPRVQQAVRPIQVDYVCDECGDSKCFNETYPCIRYAPERDLLNLDSYVQQT